MESCSALVGLLGRSLNASLVASLGTDPSWTIAEDWGIPGWRAIRVPAGIKFQRTPAGIVSEEVLVVRANESQRAFYQQLLAKASIPVHLVFMARPEVGHNRVASHLLPAYGGRDQ